MRATATVTLAAAALALVACGGDGADAPAAPTRAEFIAKTDAQCKVSNARTKKLNAEAQRAADRATSEADVLRRLAPVLQRGYGQIRDNAAALQAANPPPADAAQIERLRKLYDQQAELARMLAGAAARGDADRFKSLAQEQRDLRRRARKAARAYGFKECGSRKSDAA